MRPAGEAHQPSASSDISEGLWSRTAADPTDSASGGGKKSHTLPLVAVEMSLALKVYITARPPSLLGCSVYMLFLTSSCSK